MMQYWSHFKYTMIHKWYVLLECHKRGILWRGIKHDMSKFLPSEFSAYANFFFYADGTRRDPDNPPLSRQVAAFDRAWVHHANWNDHHWNYWAEAPHNSVNRDVREAVIMSIPAMKEMVADMIGASRAQGNENYEKSASEFYFKHLKSGRIVLHPVTETFVSTEFGILARRVINDNS